MILAFLNAVLGLSLLCVGIIDADQLATFVSGAALAAAVIGFDIAVRHGDRS